MARYHSAGAAFQAQWGRGNETCNAQVIGGIATCPRSGRKGLYLGCPCHCHPQCAPDQGAACPACGLGTNLVRPGGHNPVSPYMSNATQADLWDCRIGCSGYVPQAVRPPLPPQAKTSVTKPVAKQEANGCDRVHIDPDQFAERSAILQERTEEALALATKHNHKLERILVLNAFSDEPLVIHCNVCGESLTIQQKRHLAMGEEGFKGPILYFDCARLQRRST